MGILKAPLISLNDLFPTLPNPQNHLHPILWPPTNWRSTILFSPLWPHGPPSQQLSRRKALPRPSPIQSECGWHANACWGICGRPNGRWIMPEHGYYVHWGGGGNMESRNYQQNTLDQKMKPASRSSRVMIWMRGHACTLTRQSRIHQITKDRSSILSTVSSAAPIWWIPDRTRCLFWSISKTLRWCQALGRAGKRSMSYKPIIQRGWERLSYITVRNSSFPKQHPLLHPQLPK